jgi:hypothetical protein
MTSGSWVPPAIGSPSCTPARWWRSARAWRSSTIPVILTPRHWQGRSPSRGSRCAVCAAGPARRSAVSRRTGIWVCLPAEVPQGRRPVPGRTHRARGWRSMHSGWCLMLTTQGLGVRFGQVRAVDGVNLDLAAGDDPRPRWRIRMRQDDVGPHAPGIGKADAGDGCPLRGAADRCTWAEGLPSGKSS